MNQVIREAITDKGDSLYDLSEKQTILLVFLRHFNCVFCREAMYDIGQKREEWKKINVRPVLVHMSSEDVAGEYFKEFNLEGVDAISDPEQKYYKAFGLGRGGVRELLGLKNFVRGMDISINKKIYPGLRFIGDGFQMPGVFIIHNGNVQQSFIHKSAADRPDYDKMLSCCVT